MESTDERRGVNLLPLLESGKFSDLQISCKGGDFAVHKAIVCAQSPVINAEYECKFEELAKNVTNIEDFDVGTLQSMLEFLYSGGYSVSPHIDSNLRISGSKLDSRLEYRHSSQTHGTVELFDSNASTRKLERLRWHLNANAIGDCYGVQHLCQLARAKTNMEFEKSWSPDDFLHLLRETCTSRKTGDIRFHRLLGHIAAEHSDDLDQLQELDDVNIPAAVSTSFVSCIGRIRSLENEIRNQRATIDHLQAQASPSTHKESLVLADEDDNPAARPKPWPCHDQQQFGQTSGHARIVPTVTIYPFLR